MRADRRSSEIDRDRPTGTLDFADLADRLAAMGDQHAQTRLAAADQASRHLSALLDALVRVRDAADPATVLDRAGRELCAAAVFDRVMVSRVSGSTWFPTDIYTRCGDGRVVTEVDVEGAGVDGMAIALASPLVEAEVVRRRLPALVCDADDEPRAHRPLVERTSLTNYVVASVVAGGSVIGLLHADIARGGRPLADLDRDLIRMFADGVGLVYERVDLAERERLQWQAVLDACSAIQGKSLKVGNPAAFARDRGNTENLCGTAAPAVPAAGRNDSCTRRESGRLARLTAREREVLALLASGATNAQLADQLTVAESTVKSHVKHILHKLGATNRAAAISSYLREARDERRPR